MVVSIVLTAFQDKEIQNINPAVDMLLSYNHVNSIILCVRDKPQKIRDLEIFYEHQKKVHIVNVNIYENMKGADINKSLLATHSNVNYDRVLVISTLCSVSKKWFGLLQGMAIFCKGSHFMISGPYTNINTNTVLWKPVCNTDSGYPMIDYEPMGKHANLKRPPCHFLGHSDFFYTSKKTFTMLLNNYDNMFISLHEKDIFGFSFNLFMRGVNIYLPNDHVVYGERTTVKRITKQQIDPESPVDPSIFMDACKIVNDNLDAHDRVVHEPLPVQNQVVSPPLNAPKQTKSIPGMKRIFISIASFMDSQLDNTINDMIQKADHPERLVFGVVNQHTIEEMKAFKRRHIRDPLIKVIDVFHKDSKGCCWARSKVQTLLTNEELYMQIDAHHRFIDHWDTTCEVMLEQCKRYSKKPILSTYATICTMEDNQFKITHQDAPFRMHCERFYDFPKIRYVPEVVPNWKTLQEPQPWFTISAHFIFTESQWVREVPYDPDLYFDGEEDTLGIRSWTNGWDIFYPHKVVLYHYYIRAKEPKPFSSDKDWHIRNKNAKIKINYILGIEKPPHPIDPKYMLGTKRTYQQYVDKYKVNYHTRTISGLPSVNNAIGNNVGSKKMGNKEHDFNRINSGKLAFTHEKGKFVKMNDDSWEEQTGEGKYTFTEIDHSNGVYTIEDKTRNATIKIEDKDNSKCEIKFGENPFFVLYRFMSRYVKKDENPLINASMSKRVQFNSHALEQVTEIPARVPKQPQPPVQPSVPAQPKPPVKPAVPAQPKPPVKPAVPAQPKPAVPAQPKPPVKPAVPAQPTKPAVPAQPKPAESPHILGMAKPEKNDIEIDMIDVEKKLIRKTLETKEWSLVETNKTTNLTQIEDSFHHYVIKDEKSKVEYKVYKLESKVEMKLGTRWNLYSKKIEIVKQPTKPAVFNPGKNIAIVMAFTPNIYKYALIAEQNVTSYAKENGYTCYIYRDTVVPVKEHPTWNKPLVLDNHIGNHDYIMWMDADAIFTNYDIRIEDITNKQPNRSILLCNDIGGWKFNAGVQIWKNTSWAKGILKEWWESEHVEHLKGGDQVQLIDIIKKQDSKNYFIFNETEFNCHPKSHKRGMYVMHMMGIAGSIRYDTFTKWNSLLIGNKIDLSELYPNINESLKKYSIKTLYHIDCGHESVMAKFLHKLPVEYRGFDKDNQIIVHNNKRHENLVFKQEFNVNNIDLNCDAILWVDSRTPSETRLIQLLKKIKTSSEVRYVYAPIIILEYGIKLPKPLIEIDGKIGVWDAFFLRALQVS